MYAIKDLAKETFRKWYAFSPNPPSNKVNYISYDVEDIKGEIIEILLDPRLISTKCTTGDKTIGVNAWFDYGLSLFYTC